MRFSDQVFLELDTSSESIYGNDFEEDVARYCARQELLAAVLDGQMHPDDLLDCLQTDLGVGAADSYLMRF